VSSCRQTSRHVGCASLRTNLACLAATLDRNNATRKHTKGCKSHIVLNTSLFDSSLLTALCPGNSPGCQVMRYCWATAGAEYYSDGLLSLFGIVRPSLRKHPRHYIKLLQPLDGRHLRDAPSDFNCSSATLNTNSSKTHAVCLNTRSGHITSCGLLC
jgi:hypothetical protein